VRKFCSPKYLEIDDPDFGIKVWDLREWVSSLLYCQPGAHSDLYRKVTGDLQEVSQASKWQSMDAAICCPEHSVWRQKGSALCVAFTRRYLQADVSAALDCSINYWIPIQGCWTLPIHAGVTFLRSRFLVLVSYPG